MKKNTLDQYCDKWYDTRLC